MFASKKNILCAVLFAASFFCATPAPAQSADGPESLYEIGVLADYSRDDVIRHWVPTARYLSDYIQHADFTIVPLNYSQIYGAVSKGQVDFVIANPGILVEAMYLYKVRCMASLSREYNGWEFTHYGSVLFTAQDSGIKTLGDLKGARFAAPAPDSFGGWILAAREMQYAGLNVQSDLSEIIFVGSHDHVVDAVLEGKADAGAVHSGVLEHLSLWAEVDLGRLRILKGRLTMNRSLEGLPFHTSTPLFPEWSIAKLPHVSEDLAGLVTEGLFRLSQLNPDAAQQGGYKRWIVPLNYTSVRQALSDVQGSQQGAAYRLLFLDFLRDYWYVFFLVFLIFFYLMFTILHRAGLSRALRRSKLALEKELLQHKQAEESLRESQKMLTLVMDSIPVRVFWKDRNLTYLGCNQVFAEDAGLLSSESIVGKTDYELSWTRDQADSFREYDQRVIGTGRPIYNIIESQQHADGNLYWLKTNKVPMRDSYGNVIGMLGTYEDITESRRAEEALRTSEAKYRDLVENANSIIIRLNARGDILFFNEFAEKYFGYSEDEVVGKNLKETILPSDIVPPEWVDNALNKILMDSDEWRFAENQNAKKNGEIVWVAWTNRAVVNEQGEKEILAVGTDITQRRHMEEELRKLFTAVEQSQNVILITDPRGDIEYVNPKFTELTGYQEEEVLGKNPRLLKSGESPPEVYKVLWQTIRDGETWRGEFHNRRKDGSLYWERAAISPVKNDQGETVYYIAIKEDITEQKKLSQELQKAFGRLKEMERIINLSNAMVFLWDPQDEWPVRFVSDNVRVLGYEPREFYENQLHFQHLIYEEDVAMVKAEVERNIKARKDEFSQQYRLQTRDGRVRWFEVYTWVTYWKAGQPSQYQGVAFDITERKLAEERMFEAINMKAEFISIVSHELRTPLTAIKESINIVIEDEDSGINDSQKHFLSIAKRNVDRLGVLINDVLDYQKLDAGQLKFQWQEGDIRTAIDEVVQTMGVVAKNKGLSLKKKVPENIPSVYFDQYRIIQVLNNLVNNAIKFTEKGEVVISASVMKDCVEISVRDTGIGIKAEDMHKLFQTFSQIQQGIARKPGDSGLGLAISKKIINGHGGEIWVESEPGEGSAFFFTLPLTRS
ncbi:MAG: PAS domain S-box protein [Candidatus Omnitrophota bacterium]